MNMNQFMCILSKGDAEAKYNIESIELVDSFGFKKNELRMIESLLDENKEIIIERWKEYFKKGGKNE